MATRSERKEIARRRLVNILQKHTVALGRTLEQKIADAGPYNQRIDPHILTEARRELIKEGRIIRLTKRNIPWFHLDNTPPTTLTERLQEQEPIHQAIMRQAFTKRVGQALEIAAYRAFCSQETLETFGRFHDLETHDDSTLFRKEEPPTGISGREIPGDRKLDFLARHSTAGWVGIEIKNIREWMYINRLEVKELLAKCLYLNAVPVLIARRIPYVTRRILKPCGVLVWETYNQRYPAADHELATKAKDKNLLGFHDIRLGNEPGPYLTKFISEILPEELPDARGRFDDYNDLLQGYAIDGMSYEEFAARVRRREQGTREDDDWEDEGPC
ncbi:MAG: hypothetical protein IID53_08080 [Proteobacteria bacterium]|nr:hypothetical protein [Pseudomonadota bacterium]